MFVVAIATAPPEPPSPIITDIVGVFKFRETSIHLAMATDCPLCSAPTPGYAPGVSTNVIIGKLNFYPKNKIPRNTRCKSTDLKYKNCCGKIS